METVFEFRHNPDTYESAAYTVSIHRTKKGAEMAMEFHKARLKEQHDELWKDEVENFSFDWGKWWGVKETEIID